MSSSHVSNIDAGKNSIFEGRYGSSFENITLMDYRSSGNKVLWDTGSLGS